MASKTTITDGGKVCSKCGEGKKLEDFNKNRMGLGGRQSHCRKCQKAYHSQEEIRIRRKYRDNLFENKQRTLLNRSKPERKAYDKAYKQTLEYKEKAHKYNTSEMRKKYMAKYLNQPEQRVRVNEWESKKYKNDPDFKFKRLHRRALKRLKNKNVSSIKYLGCTWEEGRKYIESFLTFENGFTWENHGERWHIDHYIPLTWANGIEERRWIVCNFRNLRPLLGVENLRKGDKMPDDAEEFIKQISRHLGQV